MGWLTRTLGGAQSPDDKAAKAAKQARSSEWEAALARDGLPGFVRERLADAGAGKAPWLSTMTPAELLLAKTHGLRPIATVSGTCWYQCQRSWTEGHAAGWSSALDRIRAEASLCGANAVVDVKMRTVAGGLGDNMDFTLVGTAVRLTSLPPSRDPVVATVSALEFVRLLEMGIVPAGLAVGARYDWLNDPTKSYGGSWNWNNQPLGTLGQFWEGIRRAAHRDLRAHAATQGNGVLAHTHFGQILKREGGDKQPDSYLGRHIVIGTVVEVQRGAAVPHHIQMVVDMRDDLSPLTTAGIGGHNAYQTNESEGAI